MSRCPPQSLLDVKFIKPKKLLDIYIYIIIKKKYFLTNRINYLKTILFKFILFDRIVVRYKEGKDEAVFKEKIFRK